MSRNRPSIAKLFDRTLVPLVCLLLPAAAMAQPGDAAPATGTAEQGNSGQGAGPTTGSNEVAPADIVVTATKQGVQTLQKVPIAITALTGQMLQDRKITDFADYARFVPGLSFNNEGPGEKQYIIRGINSNGTGVATVSQYIDEIPVTGDQYQPDIRLYDIQRIEVLRGPQGTLYGSGALSGTIRTITNKPDPTKFTLDIHGSGGVVDHASKGYYQGDATVNAPLMEDKLALRVLIYGDSTPGYIDNVRLGNKDINTNLTYGGRAALRYDIDPRTNLTLTAFYQNQDLQGRNIVTVAGGGKYKTDQYVHDPFPDHFYIYNLTFNHDFGPLSLTYSSSYFYRKNHDNFDSTPYDLTFGSFFPDVLHITPDALTAQVNTSKLLTNEARVATTGNGPLSVVLGLFQQQVKTSRYTSVDTVNMAGYVTDSSTKVFAEDLHHKTDSYAVFGEVGYKFTETLKLLGGLRYFWAKLYDDRDNTFPFGGFAPPSVLPTAKDKEHKLTPKVYLSWQATPDVLAYATFAEGFRVGGSNQDPTTPLPPQDRTFGPDTVYNYEAGLKTSWLDHKLTLNIAGYYDIWKNIQVLDFTDNGAFSFTGNAGKAAVYGIEVETTARPIKGLEIGGAFSYVHAQLEKDQPNGSGLLAGQKGDRFPEVPRWSGSASIQYRWALSDALDASVQADYSYTGWQGTQFSPASPIYNRVGAYSQINARATITKGRYEVGVFGRNLTNHYMLNILQDVSDLTPRSVVPATPRTLGGTFGVHF